jgi:hypothetical protein
MNDLDQCLEYGHRVARNPIRIAKYYGVFADLTNLMGQTISEFTLQRGSEYVRILILRLNTIESQKVQVMQMNQTFLGTCLIMAVELIKRLHEPHNLTNWHRISAIRKQRSMIGDAFAFPIHGLFRTDRPMYVNKNQCFETNQWVEQIV